MEILHIRKKTLYVILTVQSISDVDKHVSITITSRVLMIETQSVHNLMDSNSFWKTTIPQW